MSAMFSLVYYRTPRLRFLIVWQLLEHKMVLSNTVNFLYDGAITKLTWRYYIRVWRAGEQVWERRDFSSLEIH